MDSRSRQERVVDSILFGKWMYYCFVLPMTLLIGATIGWGFVQMIKDISK